MHVATRLTEGTATSTQTREQTQAARHTDRYGRSHADTKAAQDRLFRSQTYRKDQEETRRRPRQTDGQIERQTLLYQAWFRKQIKVFLLACSLTHSLIYLGGQVIHPFNHSLIPQSLVAN